MAGYAHKLGIGHDPALISALPEALGIGIGAGASTRPVGGLVGGLVGSFVGGLLEGIGLGLPAGIVNGLGVGVAVALAIWICGRRVPAHRKPEWRPKVGISGGIVIGVALGLVAWREEGMIAGIIMAVVIGVAASLPFGLRDAETELDAIPSPVEAFKRDLQTFRSTALKAGVAAGCAGFAGGGLSSAFEKAGTKASLLLIVVNGLGIGIASGIVIGLAFGFYHAASPAFMIKNWWLAIQRKAPWQLMRFLKDAHKKTVLREAARTISSGTCICSGISLTQAGHAPFQSLPQNRSMVSSPPRRLRLPRRLDKSRPHRFQSDPYHLRVSGRSWQS